MNSFIFNFLIVVVFNYLILNVLAENDYYIVSIRRSIKDKEYDEASLEVQDSIDELVNDRMNDIYDVIVENKDTYVLEDGKIDKKLEEVETSTQLRKRNEHNEYKKYKFRFINKNRPQKQEKFRRSLNDTNVSSSSFSEEDKVEYIPFESELINHICPVLNYYVIRAYLSDEAVRKVKKLPNVINCEKSLNGSDDGVIYNNNNFNSTDINNKYYNEKEILEETKWNGLGIQENGFDFDLRFSHLSMISQGRYNDSDKVIYDNNYYYPSSAGKGINIYVIDSGLNTTSYLEDFDEYEGTPDERSISCDYYIDDGIKYDVPKDEKKNCKAFDRDSNHGTYVSVSAIGTINGVAKKANLHVIAASLKSENDILAFDIIKQNSPPEKTVINLSHSLSPNTTLKDKVKEMINAGYIIFSSAGNKKKDACSNFYPSLGNVISVGSLNNKKLKIKQNMEVVYTRASYSNYGSCVTIYAPGTLKITRYPSDDGVTTINGTSFSSPFTAGVAATLMSENSNIQYNNELMKKTLIDLSLKDAIKDLDKDSPNLLVNNGKHLIYQPPRCDDPSGLYTCDNGCCSKYGHCVDPETEFKRSRDLCLIKNYCQSEFGHCHNE